MAYPQQVNLGGDGHRKSQSLPRFPSTGEVVRKKSATTGTEKDLRIVVLGDSGVGKTALVVRFLTRRFIGDYAHCETTCGCTRLLDSKPVRLWIWDTVQDISPAKREEQLKWADAFVIVFSLTSLSSFQSVEQFNEQICNAKGKNGCRPPTVIVGSKSDLCHLREVDDSDILRLEEKLGCPCILTSASENCTSVMASFTRLLEEVLKSNRDSPDKRYRKNGSSKMAQLRETLRSLTDFRSRTNTF